jgi:AcrR family transcriptional regulator
MSPRPRKASDEDLYAATFAVMSRSGPRDLSLAAIAREAGVTPAVLVQRFGSKRRLLLTLAEQHAGATAQMFAGLRAAAASPLGAIRGYADCMAGLGATPEAAVRSLAWLHQDLADPDFRRHLLAQSRATRAALARLVREAVSSGELLSETRPGDLARAVETTVSGSLMSWAVHQQGNARAWLRHDLEATLGPWLAAPGRTSLRRRTGRARRS